MEKVNAEVQQPRVRLVNITVQVQAFADDGNSLQPLELSPATIPAADLERLPELIRQSLSDIEKQLTKPKK